MTDLKRIIEEKGVSQRRLAKQVGVTEVSMSRYVSGERTPKAPMAIRIADVLGVDVKDLYGWDDEHVVGEQEQPETHEKRTETHACDCIERQAVEHLDRFTKLYCRDKSMTDDLAFRCRKCEFEMPDKTCLVKVMARKLCPDYKDFGAMGDL